MTERFALIEPFLNTEVRKLIRRRLTRREGLIRENSDEIVSEKRRGEIKIALLAVHIINPFEEFFDPEEALIRGVHVHTLKKLRSEEKGGGRALKKL